MAKKATNYEIIQRVTWVVDALLDGLTRYEICHYASKPTNQVHKNGMPGWGMSNRQTDRYIRFANTRIGRMAEKAEEKAFDKIRARLEREYRRAVQKQDGRLVRMLLQDMRELYGFDKLGTVFKLMPNVINIEYVDPTQDEEANGKLNGANGELKGK